MLLASHKRSSSDAAPSSDDIGISTASHSLFRYGPCPRLHTVTGDEAAAAAAAAVAIDSDAMSIVSTESAPLPSIPHMSSTPTIQEDIEMPSSPPSATKSRAETTQQEQSAHYDIELAKVMLKQSQMWFPAEAGVFVGNLPAKGYSDADLTRLVLCHFAKIAPCFGKVERTTSTVNGKITEKPWAIIQFTVSHPLNTNSPAGAHTFQTVPDAERAIASSQSLHFRNRRARVQPLNANRTI